MNARQGMYYHRDGTPFAGDDVLEFAREFEAMDRRVALTEVTDKANPDRTFRVSTVFLVLNHQYSGGPPLIFETMVFGASGDDEGWQDRYSTEQQARQGHTTAVMEFAAKCVDPVVADLDEPVTLHIDEPER